MCETKKIDPPAPRVVAGRYQLIAPLGEGGIGTVWSAEDLAQPRRVAVKLLRPELASDREVCARFEREANAMAAFAHQHIVQALAVGRTPERDVYLVMELVEGETLRTTLARLKPFPLDVALALAGQLCAALAHAHAFGVVHRDLKPENVLVTWAATPDGARPHARVLDFGMARIAGGVLGGAVPLTRRGAVFGTPEYMAPEQAMGRPVDARADQYALGVMLFEMLAGQRPFRADNPLDLVQMQIHAPPPALCEVAPTVPAGVGAVVARMLAKHPVARFADAQEAWAALAEGATPPAPQPAPEAGRTASRRWWQAFGR